MLRFFVVTGVMALATAPTLAQPALADDTGPYRTVYDTSQQFFDQCGDIPPGDLYRKVVREKVDHCPFPDAEKADFRSWADACNAASAAQSTQAMAAGAVPGTPAEQRRCKALQEDPGMREAIRRLDRYVRGQGSANNVIEEECRRSAL